MSVICLFQMSSNMFKLNVMMEDRWVLSYYQFKPHTKLSHTLSLFFMLSGAHVCVLVL